MTFNFGHGERPKVRPPRRPFDIVCNALSLLAMVAGVVVVGAAWTGLPETIPIHFNAAGEADGWGGKATLWLLPGIAVVMVPSMLLLQRVPWIANTPIAITPANAAAQYGLIVRLLAMLGLMVSLIFLMIVIEIVVTAHGGKGPLGIWMLPAIIAPMTASIVWYIVAALRLPPGDPDPTDDLSSAP